jgi:hypothetical protein
MNKNVAAVRVGERDEVADVVELAEDLRVSLAGIVGAAREGLLAMSASEVVDVGGVDSLHNGYIWR